MTRRALWVVVLAGIGLLSAGIAVLVLRHNVAANRDEINRIQRRADTTVTGAPGPAGPPGSSVTVTVPVRVGGGPSTGTTSPRATHGTTAAPSTSPTTGTTRPPSTTTTRCTVALNGRCVVH